MITTLGEFLQTSHGLQCKNCRPVANHYRNDTFAYSGRHSMSRNDSEIEYINTHL